jgi:IS30 family transposase
MLRVYKSSPYDLIHKLDDKVFNIYSGQFMNITYRKLFKLENVTISKSTIYYAIHNPKIRSLKPYMLLMQYKKGKKYIIKEGKRINGDSIELMAKELLGRDMNCV